MTESAGDPNVLMAVLGSDRWRSAIMYSLRTDNDRPVTVLVTRSPGSENDDVLEDLRVEIRAGRFRDTAMEGAFLDSFSTKIAEK